MQEGSEDFCENGRESEKFNEKRENGRGNEGEIGKIDRKVLMCR